MAEAYERFAVNKHIEEHDKKVEAYEVILLRSTMTEEEVMKKLSLSYLSKEELEEIFSYYADSPRSISVQKWKAFASQRKSTALIVSESLQ